MIVQKDKNLTRFGMPRTWICPWVGKVTMAAWLFTLVWGCRIEPPLHHDGDGWDENLRTIALDYAADAAEHDIPPGRLGQIYIIREDTAKVAEAATPEEPFVVGICVIAKGLHGRWFRGEIYVNEGLEEEMLRRVMYHELTHCVYEQEHWGEQGDIQYPTVDTVTFTWEEATERHWAELRSRLIKQSRN